MAGDKQDGVWPLSKFYFQVKIADQEALFQEVSGLDIEAQVIEYRYGNSSEFPTIKMPGIGRLSNVTLKKGVFKGDNKFWDWFDQIKENVVERNEVKIRLVDESSAPMMVWTLKNAWPTKITGTDLKPEGNEVVVETLEIAHEGLR